MHALKSNENNENMDKLFFKDNHWYCWLEKNRIIKRIISITKKIRLARTSLLYENDFNLHIFNERCRDRGDRINNKTINLMVK
jgi:hypothetical protein